MKKIPAFVSFFLLPVLSLFSQSAMINAEARAGISLNGKWEIILDPFDAGAGNWNGIWKDQTPTGKNDFYEYKFDESLTLEVPGDWNSQKPELKYYEGTVWYRKKFGYTKRNNKKLFLYFSAVSYECTVYINGEKAGSHEGGFTPFQFDVTNQIKNGINTVIVRANNQRAPDHIPAMNFDWWNYGGITRDVYLLETPVAFIEDYFIQLARGSDKRVKGWVKLNAAVKTKVFVNIPELKVKSEARAVNAGTYLVDFTANLNRWSPENPKVYDVIVKTETDSVHESIGFRNIDVKGTEILLNGKPVFLKGANIHEEIPQRAGRAWSATDASLLLTWAKELGCNFVRLTHYPQNEHMVRLADKMGLMIWEEIPLWQGIQFSNPEILKKANNLLDEMINRDKNRCGIILWSLSNETSPSPSRNKTLTDMAAHVRSIDSTRLITAAFNQVKHENKTITIDDSLSVALDVLAVNEYLGWYKEWPGKPEEIEWKTAFNKPLIMSEFGAEALYGNHGSADTLSLWTEEAQEKIYQDQVTMLKKIPFLRGTIPWILADFRSPNRRHPVYQEGWNRKGLLGNNGLRKKAWFVIHEFYQGR